LDATTLQKFLIVTNIQLAKVNTRVDIDYQFIVVVIENGNTPYKLSDILWSKALVIKIVDHAFCKSGGLDDTLALQKVIA